MTESDLFEASLREMGMPPITAADCAHATASGDVLSTSAPSSESQDGPSSEEFLEWFRAFGPTFQTPVGEGNICEASSSESLVSAPDDIDTGSPGIELDSQEPTINNDNATVGITQQILPTNDSTITDGATNATPTYETTHSDFVPLSPPIFNADSWRYYQPPAVQKISFQAAAEHALRIRLSHAYNFTGQQNHPQSQMYMFTGNSNPAQRALQFAQERAYMDPQTYYAAKAHVCNVVGGAGAPGTAVSTPAFCARMAPAPSPAFILPTMSSIPSKRSWNAIDPYSTLPAASSSVPAGFTPSMAYLPVAPVTMPLTANPSPMAPFLNPSAQFSPAHTLSPPVQLSPAQSLSTPAQSLSLFTQTSTLPSPTNLNAPSPASSSSTEEPMAGKGFCAWPNCRQFLDGRNKIRMHLLQVHKIDPFAKQQKCEFPHANGAEKRMLGSSLARHIYSVHFNGVAICRQCGSTLSRSDALGRHEEKYCDGLPKKRRRKT